MPPSASQSIGGKGQVVAIDISPMEALAGVEVLHLDFMAEDAEARLKALMRDGHADVVLSDMAAPTIGHTRTDHLRIMGLAEAAAHFACDVLRPGGTFIAKVLQGGTERELLDLLEEALCHRAPRQAAGEPLRQRRALRRGDRFPPGVVRAGTALMASAPATARRGLSGQRGVEAVAVLHLRRVAEVLEGDERGAFDARRHGRRQRRVVAERLRRLGRGAILAEGRRILQADQQAASAP